MSGLSVDTFATQKPKHPPGGHTRSHTTHPTLFPWLQSWRLRRSWHHRLATGAYSWPLPALHSARFSTLSEPQPVLLLLSSRLLSPQSTCLPTPSNMRSSSSRSVTPPNVTATLSPSSVRLPQRKPRQLKDSASFRRRVSSVPRTTRQLNLASAVP